MIVKKKLSCILLVDDDYEDNVFHKLIISRMNIAESIEEVNDGIEALDYLKKSKAPRKRRFLRERYAHDELATLSDSTTVRLDTAAVKFDEPLRERQPDSEPPGSPV